VDFFIPCYFNYLLAHYLQANLMILLSPIKIEFEILLDYDVQQNSHAGSSESFIYKLMLF
jgi:hypothetical protein